MSYSERASYIEHIRRIGCPFIDVQYSDSLLTSKDRMQTFEQELRMQNKEISTISKKVELTVCITIYALQLSVFVINKSINLEFDD